MDSNDAAPAKFRHMETLSFQREDAPGLLGGQTSWSYRQGGVVVAIGWDWAEIQRGVIALADPMAIVCNARFIGHSGEVLNERMKVLALNAIVYQLPWQEQVCAVVFPKSVPDRHCSVVPKSGVVVEVLHQRLALAA
ncbi:hypothetical protein [Ottowia sp.]|uniref:hypothetical protein n=1 Tax=Ottowia sp. TaxID=1898956 RepID=UPI0025ED9C2A|nr:hypothetical protein [Ottowia sp.]MBK6616394.1 hypothetical protein [Ottowia sp.]